MKYKALFVDVDDTLVIHGLDSLPSQKVTEAITRARENGIHVGLATSRPLHAVKHIIEHLHLTGLSVISGGTQIYDATNGNIIHEVLLPKPAIPDVLMIAKEASLKVGMFDGFRDHLIREFVLPESARVIAMYLPEVDLGSVETIEDKLRTIEKTALHRMLSWDKRYSWIDITSIDATKRHGIEHVAALLGLKTEEIVGIGDGYNDVPLFEAVGLKVAMGNAVPELKEKADFTAPPVTEDGLAIIVEKLFTTPDHS